jgi:hypothetical protein
MEVIDPIISMNTDNISLQDNIINNESLKKIELLDEDSLLIKGVEIKDTLNILSKNQKTKIKQWVKEFKSDHYILNNICYNTSTNIKYNKIELSGDNNKKIVSFLYIDNKKDLRAELKNKLRHKILSRKTNLNKPWKLYYQLLNHMSHQSLPKETIEKILPNPDQIQKDPELYKNLLSQCSANPLMKEYLQVCLNS